MEILDKFSAKSIAFAGYTLTGVALILSLINVFFVYHVSSTYKKTRRILQDTREKAETELQKQLGMFEERIDKMRLATNRISEQFILGMDNKGRILNRLNRVMYEEMRKKMPDRKMMRILDEIFKEELNKHEIESFIADLQSVDKAVKERAIWGVEAIGPEKVGREKTVEILGKIVDDPNEDPEIRLQAQRSIENVKRSS